MSGALPASTSTENDAVGGTSVGGGVGVAVRVSVGSWVGSRIVVGCGTAVLAALVAVGGSGSAVSVASGWAQAAINPRRTARQAIALKAASVIGLNYGRHYILLRQSTRKR